jgi:hypothetical protein
MKHWHVMCLVFVYCNMKPPNVSKQQCQAHTNGNLPLLCSLMLPAQDRIKGEMADLGDDDPSNDRQVAAPMSDVRYLF